MGGPEFEELQGHVLVMYIALYGTKSGGACWHDKFFDILHHMGFKALEVDWGGHGPNPNHVNESLLSEVDWGAHTQMQMTQNNSLASQFSPLSPSLFNYNG